MCQTDEEVQGLISGYEAGQKHMREHITSIVWHMRGGYTREEAWRLSPTERKDIMSFIEERIKLVEKTGLPLI